MDTDVIVIGAGAGGLTASIGLAKAGKKVILIEKGYMGGDCTNFGCIPSKRLIHLARSYNDALRMGGNGKELEQSRDSILEKTRNLVTEIRSNESPEELEKFGISVIKGEARFIDNHSIAVVTLAGEKHYRAKHIIIATGSRPRQLTVVGANEGDVLTNETIFSLKKIPSKLLIVGAGPIGCELGQAFAHLGTKVTILDQGNQILSREDPAVSELTEKLLRRQDIEILHHATLQEVKDRQAKVIIAKPEEKPKCLSVDFEHILISIGRVPNSESIGLHNIHVSTTDHGLIPVDQHYRVKKHKNIFAIGDVASPAQFTHVADDMARHVIKKILFPLARVSKQALPRVTYLDEEIATVGMTPKEAQKIIQSEELLTLSLPYQDADRAKTDDLEGMIQVTVKKLSGKVMGASIMGRGAGELINVFTIAMDNNLSLWRVAKSIYPYPVLGRLIKKLGDQFLAYTIGHLKEDIWYVCKKHFNKILALFFWGAVIMGFYGYQQMMGMSSVDLIIQLYNIITGTWYGPLLYMIVYAIRPVIFFPATLLTLLSGILYGFWGGVLYTIIGENISASIAYLLGRFLGKGLFPLEGQGIISTWKRRLQRNGFNAVLMMRLFFLPFDLVNYLCEILHVPYFQYLAATMIGIIPGLTAFVSLGASVEIMDLKSLLSGGVHLKPEFLIMGLIFFLSSITCAHWLRKHRQVKS